MSISFDNMYIAYCICGLSACHYFALLRGKGIDNPAFLIGFRLYFVFLVLFYVYKKSTILTMIIVAYIPYYCNLSEFYGTKNISKSIRNGSFARWCKNYFGCELISTLQTDVKQCIIGLHPHGILPFGTIVNIATETTEFSKKCPSLSNRVVIAASTLFLYPGFRELIISLGVVDCSLFNAERWLNRGYCVAVFPGGTREALYANPDVEWLDLRRKLGFVRLAMRRGLPLLPVYTFNEVDHFKQLPYDYLDKYPLIRFLRIHTQKLFGLPLFPFVSNIIPPRSKVTTVIGNIVEVPHISNPTDEEVVKCLDKYIEAVQKLYDEHAPKYVSVKHRKLVIS